MDFQKLAKSFSIESAMNAERIEYRHKHISRMIDELAKIEGLKDSFFIKNRRTDYE